MSRTLDPVPDGALTPADLAKPATYGTVMMAVDLVPDVFAKLDARVAAVEAQSLPHYEGIHEPGKTYPAGSLTTRQGGLWLAVEPTDRTPGAGAGSAWKLIVKSGGI
jgi:hypothetical protein